jgi:hypothetical protein
LLISRLENRPEIEAALMASFEKFLAHHRAAQPEARKRHR